MIVSVFDDDFDASSEKKGRRQVCLLCFANAFLSTHMHFSYSLATEAMRSKLLRGPREAAAE